MGDSITMATATEFLALIRQNPDEDAPRLLYADWLAGLPDPSAHARAELIRLQCALQRATTGRQDSAARQRVRELSGRFGDLWRNDLPVHADLSWHDWERGLIEGATISRWELIALEAERFFEATCLRRIRFQDHRPAALREFLACQCVKQVQHLELAIGHLDLASASALAGTERLTDLRCLDLHGVRLSQPIFRVLASAGSLAGLKSLILSRTQITPNGSWLALSSSSTLEGLQKLDLSGNLLGDVGVRAFLHFWRRRQQPTQLEELRLASVGLTGQGALELIQGLSSTRLRRLDLRHNPIEDAAGVDLIRLNCSLLDRLDSLGLSGNQFRPQTRAGVLARFGNRIVLK